MALVTIMLFLVSSIELIDYYTSDDTKYSLTNDKDNKTLCLSLI